MTKVCNKCFDVIRPDSRYNKCSFHTNTECDGALVEIDDNLSDIISKLWKKNIKTYACCGGHLTPLVIQETSKAQTIDIGLPYICVQENLLNFLNKLKDTDDRYVYLEIETSHLSCIYPEPPIKICKISVNTLLWNTSLIQYKLEYQYIFLLFLYDLWDNLMTNKPQN